MKLKISSPFLLASVAVSTVIASGVSAQNIFVANWYEPGAIYEFTPGNPQHTTFYSGDIGEPEIIAFDRSGNLFVANSAGDEIKLDGSEDNFASVPDPHGLAFDGAGDLFVDGNRDGNVYKIKRGSTDATTFATGLTTPGGMAFDKAGNLFVSSGGANGVIVEYKSGSWGLNPNETLFAQGITGPADMAFDEAGNLYVGNDDSQITKFTPQGDSSVYAKVKSPGGMAFDKEGNLFVCNNGKVTEIAPGGGAGNVVASDLGNCTGLAIQGIALVTPTSSIWLLPVFSIIALLLLLLLIVLGVILFFVFRRKKTQPGSA
jgi:sugar lactone lactonase YvrE